MKAAMYIFVNKGLLMSPGKIAAQAGHAAAEATLLSHPDLLVHPAQEHIRRERTPVWRAWRDGLHYAKYVMEARDTEHLIVIEKYLTARGFRTHLVIDEGHTEVPALTPTALGVALVDKDDPHTAATFSSFKLYRDERPQPPEPGPPRPKPCPCAPRVYRQDPAKRLRDQIVARWGSGGLVPGSGVEISNPSDPAA